MERGTLLRPVEVSGLHVA